MSELFNEVRRRLPAGATVADRASCPEAVNVELPPACFICRPGLQRLVAFENPEQDHWQVEMGSHEPLVAGAPIPTCGSWLQVMLRRREYELLLEVDVTRPLPSRYNRSGKWKRFAPSRRRHMKSWRFAPDEEKLRYAPVAGFKRLPWWALHPDLGRCLRLGKAIVKQPINVFAQPSADIHDIMQEYSGRWCFQQYATIGKSAGG